MATFLLNMLIAVLLSITIAYCWLLNRRIKVLQDSKSELAQLLKHFDESTQRASESIIALQTASKKIGENIQFRIDKANFLLDDLSFMIDRGGKLANQMEANLAISRAQSKAMAPPPPAAAGEAEEAPPETFKATEKPSATAREKTSASLEAVLERVVGRGGKTPAPEETKVERSKQERQAARARSKAEQELLEMIKAGIKG